ncbi:tetratricopeptide repeat protein [Saccharicrinis sp. FJH2]|uniref:tetratricopeptide repeat-containing sensor histidine kinase n=1 Tax=Saccharicrinis sp. FJH65 TaxID=3344659 RepID=UPI0035F3EAB9
MKKILLTFLWFSCITLFSQAPDIDSLIMQSEQATGKEKIMLLSDISYYSGFYDTKLSLEYAQRCLDAAESFGDSLIIAEAYNALAIAYYATSNYETSLEYNQKALKIRLNHGNEYSLVSSYSKIGNCLYDLGKMDEAIPYYLKAMEITERNNLLQQTGMIANNIADIFRSLGQAEKAEQYFLQAISIAKEMKDTLGLAKANVNYGIFNRELGNYTLSDSLYNASLTMIKDKNYLDLEAGIYINYGVMYKDLGNLSKSIEYYTRAKNIYLKTGEKHGLAIVYSNLGNSYLQQNKKNLAYQYYIDGLQLAEETNSLSRKKFAHESLSNYYRATGNYRMAYMEDSISDVLNDSIYSIEKSRIIEEMNTKYETQKKERQIAEQKIVLADQKLKVQKKNTQLIGSFGLVAIIILSSGFIYSHQKNKQRQLVQQVELEKTNTINRIQEEKLRISRDLHDNIGSQLTFMISTLDNMKYLKTEERRSQKLKDLGHFTKNTMTQLRETIWAMNSGEVNMDQLCSRVAEFINQAKMAQPLIHFDLKTKPSQKIFSANETIQIFRTVQEAINNAVKHSSAETITVSVDANCICIEDDGNGFNAKTVTEGNGLSNMEQRISDIGFIYSIETQKAKGTKITITFET